MKRSVKWLLLIVVLSLSLNIPPAVVTNGAAVFMPQMSREPGVYLTPYKTATAPPQDVAEFEHFILQELPGQEHGEIKVDGEGNVPISGRLYTAGGLVYNFKTAKLIKGKRGYEQLTFTTTKLGGIHYTFTGTYTDDPELEQGQYITLKGMLNKYKDGQAVTTAPLGLYQWVIL